MDKSLLFWLGRKLHLTIALGLALLALIAILVSALWSTETVPLTLGKEKRLHAAWEMPVQSLSAAFAQPQRPKADDASRKIILRGQYGVTVKSFDPFLAHLRAELAQAGGYISEFSSARGSESVSRATLEVRVPSAGVAPFVYWLRRQGVTTTERETSEDVTEEYIDIRARLENARRFEQRLLQMLATHTAKVSELVLIEEKLGSVREQIERYEGRLRYFDKFVALSTLTIEVTVEEIYSPVVRHTFAGNAARAWSHSVHALKDFAQNVALAIIAFLPWSIPSALLALGLVLAMRRVSRFRRGTIA